MTRSMLHMHNHDKVYWAELLKQKLPEKFDS